MAWMRLAITPLLLFSLTGCQTLSEKRQTALLEDALRQYEAALRWGSMQQAQSFASANVAKFSPAHSEDLRIIHYEVVQGPTQVSDDKALQAVVIQYVHQSNQSVKELLDQQVWHYEVDTAKWTRQSPLPAFQ